MYGFFTIEKRNITGTEDSSFRYTVYTLSLLCTYKYILVNILEAIGDVVKQILNSRNQLLGHAVPQLSNFDTQ